MTTTARTCVICGSLGTEKWTLSIGPNLTVADLCPKHSKPLHEAVNAVEKRQAEVTKKSKVAAVARTVPPGKAPRNPSFAPLNWTPPEEK